VAEWLTGTIESMMGIDVQVEVASGSDDVHISVSVEEELIKGGVLVLNQASVMGLVLLAQDVEGEAQILKKCAETYAVILPGQIMSEASIERALGGKDSDVLRWDKRLPIILERLADEGLIKSYLPAEGERGWYRVRQEQK
jgi:hypothetical protein